MTPVYPWPPVGLIAWELSVEQAVSWSRSRLTGARYGSTRGRARRVATAQVRSLGDEGSAGGYMEMLKRKMGGTTGLVSIRCRSRLWLPTGDLRNSIVQVHDGGTPVFMSDGVTPVTVPENGQSGTATLDGIWPAIAVTGLPASTVVARPFDLVRVFRKGEADQLSRVLKTARSDAAGTAIIRLETAVLAEESPVSIGGTEEIVFEAVELPRAVQSLGEDTGYPWSFSEVFADEVPGGFEMQADLWR